MASVSRKPNSPYWMAKYRDDTGRIVMRSTKQTGQREARKIADDWEEAAKKARRGELTRAVGLKVLAEMVERTTGEQLIDVSIEDFLKGWLDSLRVNSKALSTVGRYSSIVTGFSTAMGDRARKSIRGLTTSDLRRFRDKQVIEGRSAVTANFSIKVLSAALERAKRDSLILVNPARSLDSLEDDGAIRQAFTDEQICMLLDASSETWKGMILLGAHAGLRLSDAANLKWVDLSVDAGTLSFIPQKTKRTARGKKTIIALHHELLNWLKLWIDKKQGPDVFPTLVGRPSGSHTGLSNEFGHLMDAAGIQRVYGEARQGKGRRSTLLSFHSLRHSCVSRLANADIHADVRKTIAGHSTDEAHARYTHLEIETQRRALKKVNGFKLEIPSGEAKK